MGTKLGCKVITWPNSPWARHQVASGGLQLTLCYDIVLWICAYLNNAMQVKFFTLLRYIFNFVLANAVYCNCHHFCVWLFWHSLHFYRTITMTAWFGHLTQVQTLSTVRTNTLLLCQNMQGYKKFNFINNMKSHLKTHACYKWKIRKM